MSRAGRAILWGGLVAGTLDIADALIFFGLRGASPAIVLQSIASGLLGAAAFRGGAATAALGLFLHFVIAFGAATVFWLASRAIPLLVRYYAIAGLLFGGAVYLFMNRVVLPLSAISRASLAPPPPIGLINGVLAVMLLVGLPIAMATRRYSK